MTQSRLYATAICVAIAMCSMLAVSSGAESAAQPTEVVIIGTIHAEHLKSESYSPEVLLEILLAVKPDAILIELPLDQVNTDGSPKSHQYITAENWATNQAASQLKVPQIPFDRPDRQQHYKKTKYFARESRLFSWWSKWYTKLEKEDPNSIDFEMVRFIFETRQIRQYFQDPSSPLFINSDVFDRVMYLKHGRSYEVLAMIFEKYPDFTPELADNLKLITQEWTERNEIMAANIEAAARKFPGGRLAVVTGSAHRYILRDLLKDRDGIILKEYWQVTDVDFSNVPASPDREAWLARKQKLLTEGSVLCRVYWQAVIDKDWERAIRVRPVFGKVENIKKRFTKNPPVSIVSIEDTRPPHPGEGTTNQVTPCVIEFEDGRQLEIKMVIELVDDRCTITATLRKPKVIRPKTAAK